LFDVADSNESADTRTPMIRHQSEKSDEQAEQPGSSGLHDTAAESSRGAQMRLRRNNTGTVLSPTESRSLSFRLRTRTTSMFTPDKKLGPPPSLVRSVWAIITNSCEFSVTLEWSS
jgi:hypothetical protein